MLATGGSPPFRGTWVALTSAATAATLTSSVGTYPISLAGGSDINDAFTLSPGTLTVAKAPLTVTADNLTRPYGATNPAEFFAVVTEEFFERPIALRAAHPALYDELAKFFRQDPALYVAEPAATS